MTRCLQSSVSFLALLSLLAAWCLAAGPAPTLAEDETNRAPIQASAAVAEILPTAGSSPDPAAGTTLDERNQGSEGHAFREPAEVSNHLSLPIDPRCVRDLRIGEPVRAVLARRAKGDGENGEDAPASLEDAVTMEFELEATLVGLSVRNTPDGVVAIAEITNTPRLRELPDGLDGLPYLRHPRPVPPGSTVGAAASNPVDPLSVDEQPTPFETITFKSPESAAADYIKRLVDVESASHADESSDLQDEHSGNHTAQSVGTFILPKDDPNVTVELREMQSMVLKLNGWIPVAIDNLIIDFTNEIPGGNDDERITVKALATGFTAVTLTASDGRSGTLSIRVVEDVRELQHMLKQLYPDAKLEVHPVRGTVLLRGTTASEHQIREIIEIAEQFYPNVLNQIRAATDHPEHSTEASEQSQTQLFLRIPPGKRVVTVEMELPPAIADDLQPGSVIDILASAPAKREDGSSVNSLILEDIVVLAVTRSLRQAAAGTAHVSLLVAAEDARWFVGPDRRAQIILNASMNGSGEKNSYHGTMTPASDVSFPAQTGQGALEGSETPDGWSIPVAASDLRTEQSLELLREVRALRSDVQKLTEVLQQRRGRRDRASEESAIPDQTAVPSASSPARLAEFADQKSILLCFTQSNSQPDQEMEPVVQELRQRGVTLTQIDVEADPELARRAGVEITPTFLRLKQGLEAGRITGVTSLETLCRFLSEEPHAEATAQRGEWMTLDLPFLPPVSGAAQHDDALVFVLAQSCARCRSIEPAIAALEEQGVPVVKLDVNTVDGAAAVNALKLSSVPTVLRIRNGRVVNQRVGVATEDEFFSFYTGFER